MFRKPPHLWYHDHAMGINRLNIYAGLFGSYFVRDEYEDALNLPRGKYEIPLAICDRLIVRFDGFPGRYVWHCHLLEHEDNEMMRPFEILPA
ncbi:MAG: multicopper oxidase domain-containing protein [Bryobacteraceae bacterium]